MSTKRALLFVFHASRADESYARDVWPGNTRDGRNSGPAQDTYVARSSDGGRTWSEIRISDVSTNPNYNTSLRTALRTPFLGDYIAIDSVPGFAYAVWTDTRDVIPGIDPRQPASPDGFDVHAPCTWTPNDIEAASYTSPTPDDPCLSQGGLDLNVYGDRIEEEALGR